MGSSLHCQKITCEEEIIQNILTKMNLTEIETSRIYEELNKCFETRQSLYINPEKYSTFINAIIGHNTYRDAQKKFFEKLMENHYRTIGPIVIIYSNGSNEEKAKYLSDYYFTYYYNQMEKLINEIVTVNSIFCIKLFKEYIGQEYYNLLIKVYTTQRIKKLVESIVLNYENIKIKYISKGNDIKEKENEEINKFLELVIDQLNGGYIRNWLYEEYLKENPDNSFLCVK